MPRLSKEGKAITPTLSPSQQKIYAINEVYKNGPMIVGKVMKMINEDFDKFEGEEYTDRDGTLKERTKADGERGREARDLCKRLMTTIIPKEIKMETVKTGRIASVLEEKLLELIDKDEKQALIAQKEFEKAQEAEIENDSTSTNPSEDGDETLV